MAGENRPENKLFQIIMVVVTSIVAPVSVYFITHTEQASASPTAAITSTMSSSLTGMSITVTPTPTPNPAMTKTPQPPTTTATAITRVQNPKGILPAGNTGIVNGMEVSMVGTEVQVKDGVASIQIHIRNQTNQPQTFAYRVQSIGVKDANGRVLEVIYGDKRNACTKKDLSDERKIELAANQEIILQSVDANTNTGWCAPTADRSLPLYQVTTKDAPAGVVIQFTGFGPFNGFGFKIDL